MNRWNISVQCNNKMLVSKQAKIWEKDKNLKSFYNFREIWSGYFIYNWRKYFSMIENILTETNGVKGKKQKHVRRN